jgi:DNA polymerase-4
MLFHDTRHIAHFDLDAFFVSVECLKNPSLAGKPLIVGGTGDRAVVAACSYETRRFGVHSAMPMQLARRLCPDAIIIRGDMESYSKHSRLVTEIIADRVPLFEKASIDEFYVDLTGMDRFFGCTRFIHELRQFIIKESGLPISYGMASNKMVSKVATNEIKPNGQLTIPFGEEKPFLAPLQVNKIPGVGKETTRLLYQMGVETIRTLSEIPREMLANLLGKQGHELWRRANGIDESPVVPFREQKSISTENTFHADTTDTQFLEEELVRMTENVGFQLREQGKLAGCVTVKLRYANFDTVTKQISIPYSSADHILLEQAKKLFQKLYDKRLLVRLIGVRLSDLVPGHQQIDLFSDSNHMIQLYQAIDSIKQQFGTHAVGRAAAIRKKNSPGH